MQFYDMFNALVKYADKKEWYDYEHNGVMYATYTYDIRLTLKKVKKDNDLFIEVYYCGNLVYNMDLLKYTLIVGAFKEQKKFKLFKRKAKLDTL